MLTQPHNPLGPVYSWSGVGEIAAVTAYAEGDAWLAALITRLDEQRSLLAEHLPGCADASAGGDVTRLARPPRVRPGRSGRGRTGERRVKLEPGDRYQAGLPGHVRLNLATSRERVIEIVRRLAASLGGSQDDVINQSPRSPLAD